MPLASSELAAEWSLYVCVCADAVEWASQVPEKMKFVEKMLKK